MSVVENLTLRATVAASESDGKPVNIVLPLKTNYRESSIFTVSIFADFTLSRFLEHFNSPLIHGIPRSFTVFPKESLQIL